MHQEIQYLITLYVSGEISPEEQEALDVAIEENPEVAVELAKAIELWGMLEAGNEEFLPSSEQALEKLQAEMEMPEEEIRVLPILRRPKTWVAAAAAILLLATSAFLLPRLLGGDGGKTYIANNGLLDFYLPDSTHVWLNQDSKIAYGDDFNADERRVSLSGEAYFEVKRDEERPFIIQTGKAETRVLGTSFNVRAYEDEESIEVAVTSGKVKFTSFSGEESRSEFLRRNERAVYDKETNTLEKELRFEYKQLSWRDNPNRLEKTSSAPQLPQKVDDDLVLPPITISIPNRLVDEDLEEEEEELFTSTYNIKENFLKQTVLAINFKNSSDSTTFENIEATVHYSTKRGEKSRIFKIDEIVRPGDSIQETRRLPDWFVNSKVLSIDVTTTERDL